MIFAAAIGDMPGFRLPWFVGLPPDSRELEVTMELLEFETLLGAGWRSNGLTGITGGGL